MRRDPHTFLDGMAQGHHSQPNVTVDGTVVNIRKLSAQDEGVLYTMQITVSFRHVIFNCDVS